MNHSLYTLYICIVTEYLRFPSFVEKKEQLEMCRKKCTATKLTNHSCCGLMCSISEEVQTRVQCRVQGYTVPMAQILHRSTDQPSGGKRVEGGILASKCTLREVL